MTRKLRARGTTMGLTNPQRRLKVRSGIDRSHPNESVCLVDVGFSSAPLQYIDVETVETLVSYGTRAGLGEYRIYLRLSRV
jgi:hypothetical protein